MNDVDFIAFVRSRTVWN